MKLKSIHKRGNLFLVVCFLIFSTFGCQDEVVDVTPTNEQDTILVNSNLAILFTQVALQDGSVDNILDGANCISINLPVTVIINDEEITIDSELDYDIIESIFDEFENDEDTLEIVFPIVIILNDYTTVEVANYEELEVFIEDCLGENEADDDIECIDFQYPIVFSIYDSNFQILQTVSIQNDAALYQFIEDLDAGVLVSLNFPVTMVLSDGSLLEVNDNEALQAAIEAAEDDCDEDDDNDWNDDDFECNEDNIINSLLDCYWNIVMYNESDIYTLYDVEFNQNLSFQMIEGQATSAIGGNWDIGLNNIGQYELFLTDLTAFQDTLEGVWVIAACEEDRLELTMENNTMVMEQDCSENYQSCNLTEDELNGMLLAGNWTIIESDQSAYGAISFNANDEIWFNFEDQSSNGEWYIQYINNEPVLTINDPVWNYSGNWVLLECTEYSLIFINGNDILHLVNLDHSQVTETCSIETMTLSNNSCDYDFGLGFASFNLLNGIPTRICLLTTPEAVYNVNLSNEYPALDLNAFYLTYNDAQTGVNSIVDAENFVNTTSYNQTVYTANVYLGGSGIHEIYLTVVDEDCDNSCTQQEVSSYFQECIWNIVNYNDSDNLINYEFDFGNDDTVVITENGQTISAIWSITTTNDGVWVAFSSISEANLQVVTGNWLITECNSNRIKLENNNDQMIMEQDCN